MLEGSAAGSSLRTPPGFPTGAAGRSLLSGSRRSADDPSRCRRDSVPEAGMVRQTSWRRPPAVEPCCGGQEHFARSEEHTSELQSHVNLVCRLLLEKKKKIQ